jgi:2'-5' RNA ligase
MAGNSETAVALWLMAEKDTARRFRELMAPLARQHGGPIFAPHLTLGLGPAALLEKIESAPIELAVAGFDCEERFTKTLFVRFVLSPALAQLRDLLGFEPDDYDPHLSLLYADLPLAGKQELCAALPPLPFPQVRFDAASAVRCRLPVATAADVAAWETLAVRPLR